MGGQGGKASKAKPSRRRILVITRNEQVGKWLRFSLAGLNTGLPTTVVSDLQAALPALTRLRPRVVIFVEEGPGKVDNRLMLLQALLLNERLSRQNTVAMVYSLGDSQLTMYHNIHIPRASLEDLVHAAREGRACPLFGYSDETAPCFPRDCGFLPLMVKSTVGTAVMEGNPVIGSEESMRRRKNSKPVKKTLAGK